MKHLFAALLLVGAAVANAQQEAPEEIVVTGVLPGPAMWRVSNGDDHVLWVFATVYPVPKDMIWESARVEKVIADAEEYIVPPDADVSVSPLVMLNPINYVRGYRLLKRLGKLPDGQTLDEVLPPEIYQRLLTLREKFLPDEELKEETRPLFALESIEGAAFAENGLGSGEFRKKIDRLLKKNRKIKRTETDVEVEVKGGFGKLADRAEAWIESLPLETQIACLDVQMRRLETGIPPMISRANSWAQGYVDEYRELPSQADASNPCFNIMLLSSEKDTVIDVMNRSNETWLAAAEHALDTNAITFAVLTMDDAISDIGLLSRLKAKGYAVREPRD